MKICRDLALRLRGLGVRLPAFQLPMFMFVKCDALLNLFPPFLFGIPSIHSLPESWGPWEPSSALCLHHAHPFVAVMHWLFSHVTVTCPWAADVRNVTHCPKEIGSTCLSNTKESILAIPFWDFQASIPYQKQVPESNSRLHHFCILLASCPSLRCSYEINQSHAKKQSFRSRSCGLQDLDYRILIVLSVVLCDCCKPMNTCRDWAFSNSGLEVGLPAFQLPMFEKCDARPKGDLFDMFA